MVDQRIGIGLEIRIAKVNRLRGDASMDYTQAGVNIDMGNNVVDLIKPLAATTANRHLLKGIGSFASFFDMTEILRTYRHPVLVQSTDGVGTKITVCNMANDYSMIGKDLFAACANDIAVHGAKPLTFLDYIANDTLEVDVVIHIIRGLCEACKEDNVCLVGGETAEMPGTYAPLEHDLVGFVTGVVEKDNIINGENVTPGDVVMAVGSTGLHTNGYSLARKVLFEMANLDLDDHTIIEGTTLKQALLAPHPSYVGGIQQLLSAGLPIKSMAHITGGGLLENIPRVLPKGVRAHLYPERWQRQAIFDLIARLGDVSNEQMYRTFNMGLGLIIVVDNADKNEVFDAMHKAFRQPVYIVGHIEQGEGQTIIKGIKATP